MTRIPRVVFVFIAITLTFIPAWAKQSANPAQKFFEVTIGAQAWSYERVYPLLDGLFQDTVSTQVANQTLYPNSSNASSLNALTQSLQIQAGYNQLSGVQSSVAAQTAVENLGYQTTLTQQEQSILQQQLSAQQVLAQDQQNLNAATASNNPAEATAANQAIAAEQATINGLAAEMTLVKGSPAALAPPAAPTAAVAPPVTSFTTAVPGGVSAAGIGGGPSFPATKQMDNQMDLLWSRLARVVGTMSRPDSMDPKDRMYLIEFDTGTFPHPNRKKHILDTRYG